MSKTMIKTNIRAASSSSAGPLSAVPARVLRPMPAQPIVPWTFTRMWQAAITWLMEEQPLDYRRQNAKPQPVRPAARSNAS
jgi:hypothetical protein